LSKYCALNPIGVTVVFAVENAVFRYAQQAG
jgi:hypothetical protein